MPFKYAPQPKAEVKPETEGLVGKAIRLYNKPFVDYTPAKVVAGLEDTGGATTAREFLEKRAQPGLKDTLAAVKGVPEKANIIERGREAYSRKLDEGHAAAEKFAQPGLTTSKPMAMLKGFAAGAANAASFPFRFLADTAPTTGAKIHGFSTGALEQLTPAVIAQRASLGTGVPAAIANSVIAGEGVYNALDSDKSAIDRGLGAVNAIGGGAGAKSGLLVAGLRAEERAAAKAAKAGHELFEIEPTIRPGGLTLSGTVKTGAKGKTTLVNAKTVPASKAQKPTIASDGTTFTPREMPDLVKKTPVGPVTPAEYAQDLARVGENPVAKTPIVGTPAEASGRVQKIVAKEQKTAAKTALDVEKAQEAANKLVGKEASDAAKAQTKYVEGEAAQTARNLNAKDKFVAKQDAAATTAQGSIENSLNKTLKAALKTTPEVSDLDKAIAAEKTAMGRTRAQNARTEAQGVRQEAGADAQNLARVNREAVIAQKAADNEANLRAIEEAKNGRVPTSPSISESVSAKTGEGQKTSMSRRFVEPAPPEGEGSGTGADGSGGTSLTGDVMDMDREALRHHRFTNKDDAKDAAIKYGAKYGVRDVKKAGRGAYYLDLGDETPGIPPTDSPTVTPTSKGPKTPPAAPAAEMAPGLDRDVIAGNRYTNKVEAAAIAKATGGTVHQQGPRQYRVKFTSEPVIPTEAPASVTPPDYPVFNDTPAINTAKTKPLADVSPTDNGLTPAENKRYRDISPGMGTKRTPEELAEYIALQQKINKANPPWVNPNSEGAKLEPVVTDYTGGQPAHGVEVPVPEALPEVTPESIAAAKATAAAERAAAEKLTPGKTITPEGKITPADVIDVGKTPLATMQEMADVANKPAPPVGKIKFPTSKLPGKSQVPDAVQGNVLDIAEPVPAIPEQGVIPAQKPSSRIEFAKQNFSAEANATLDELGNKYRTTTDKSAKRQIGQMMSEIDASERARLKTEAQQGAIPAAKAPEAPTEPGFTSDDWAKMSKQEQEQQLKDIAQTLKNRPKGGSTLSAFGAGQAENMIKIASENPAFTRALTTIVGAGAGAALDEDPVEGAVIGGGIGFGAPSVMKLMQAARAGDITKQNAAGITAKFKDAVETGFRMLPDFQRAALLSKITPLIINSIVGPWGSIVMHGLEDAAQLDPKGIKLLKLAFNPMNFPREFVKSIPRAHELIGSASERTEGLLGQVAGKQGPAWYRTMTQYPGVAMTAGDEAARDMAKLAGYSEDEARLMTLTSEPYTSGGAGLSKLKKGAINRETKNRGWLLDMSLPFYRTNTNQVEQGLERTPFVGIWMNMYAKSKPAAWQTQVAQQMIGGSTGYVGYMLGEETPPEDARNVLKFINNFGGQYGAIASAGFMIGQANAKGKSSWKAFGNELANALPMPSTQPVTDAVQNAGAVFGEGDFKMPSGFIPGIFDPEDPLTSVVAGALSPKVETSTKPVTSNFKYAPQRK